MASMAKCGGENCQTFSLVRKIPDLSAELGKEILNIGLKTEHYLKVEFFCSEWAWGVPLSYYAMETSEK